MLSVSALVRRLHATAFLLMACAGAHAADAPNAAPMRVVTANLPPFAIEDGGERPGALVELVRELGRRAAIPASFEFVPWTRAVFMAGALPRTAAFPLTRTPEREARFRWLVRLYEEKVGFIGPSGRFDPSQPAALKARPVAVLRGAAQIERLRGLGYTNLVEAANLHEALRFVRRGIADAVYGEILIVGRLYRERYPGEPFVATGPVGPPSASWLAGSLGFSEAEGARLQKAMKSMIDDGTYLAIMKKYGMPAVVH